MALIRPILVALGGIALAAPAAGAATIAMEDAPAPLAAFYVADARERNRLVVTYDPPAEGGVTVHDPGATVRAISPCTSIDSHTAHCPAPPIPGSLPRVGGLGVRLYAGLGDRGDALSSSDDPNAVGDVTAFGGSGADNLRGGRGFNRLDGGSGADKVVGGPNGDLLIDGDRGGAERSADRIEGGGGDGDFVSYRARTAGVEVDLAAGTAGEPGEGDVLVDVDGVEGGAGTDVLRGDDASNSLFGHEGGDFLEGRVGADKLDGGAGSDRIDGGEGADTLLGAGELDALDCGTSSDEVVHPSAGEVLSRSCEWLDFSVGEFGSFKLEAHPVKIARWSVSFLIGCPRYDEEDRSTCRARLKLRETAGRRRVLGRASWSVSEPTTRPRIVRVRLTGTGRRLARRRGGVPATVSFRDAAGGAAAAWSIRLRVRR